MKRLLSLLLVIAMLFGVCTMFTACDNSSASSEDKEKEEEKEESKTVKFNMKKTTVEEAVLYEKNNIKLTLTDLSVDDYSVIFYMTVENSSDVTVSFEINDAVVNGLSSVNGSIYNSVGSGDSVDVELYLYVEELKQHNMKTIGDLELTIRTQDDYYYTELDEGTRFTIQTSDTGYQHTLEPSGEELFNSDGIRILLQKTVVNTKDDGAYMLLFVENTDDEKRIVDLDNVIVNGWVLPYAYAYKSLMPGTASIERLYLDEMLDLGINKKDKIENVYFDVAVSDDDYNTLCIERMLSYIPGEEGFVQEVDLDSTVLFDNEGIQFALVSIEDKEDYTEIKLYIKNTCDELREYDYNGMVVNGESTYRGVSGTLPAGTQVLRTIQLWQGEALDSFDDLEEIYGTLYVYDQSYSCLAESYIELPID